MNSTNTNSSVNAVVSRFARRELEQVTSVAHGATIDPVLIDFSSSVVTIPIPIDEIVSKTNFFCYPDSASRDFCRAVATTSHCNPEEVTPGNGGAELLWLVGLAFLSQQSRVGLLSPTFGEYERIAKIMGASVHPLSLQSENDFSTSAEEIVAFITRETISVLFLCNPNNPTGHLLTESALLCLVDSCPKTLFVFDLAYVDYTNLLIEPSRFLERDNVILVHSLTKAFGIAGLRAGYALAHRSLTDALEKVRPPWNMNRLAQQVATFLMENRSSYLHHARACQRDAAALAEQISDHGLRVVPSATDYFMVEVGNARVCKDQLLRQGFLIRELESMGQPRFVRINACRPQFNARFLEAFCWCVNDLSKNKGSSGVHP